MFFAQGLEKDFSTECYFSILDFKKSITYLYNKTPIFFKKLKSDVNFSYLSKIMADEN